jgi:hypothetical protein
VTDDEWRRFFLLAAETLGRGNHRAIDSESWCAWTTFSRLTADAGYWTSGLLNPEEIGLINNKDGGTWGQPFPYQDIAHLIVPCRFYWERAQKGVFEDGEKTQDIDSLSQKLTAAGINHRKTDLVLEIKLY